MKMKKLLLTLVLCLLSVSIFTSCNVWGKDGQAKDPQYHYDENGQHYSFLLQLRQPGSSTEVADGDAYLHSTIDGELIFEWQIPMYGNTVYESVVKFFEGREDNMTFRLSQHTFYMFHDCTLIDGTVFNLETVYIAADGVYANCANYQSVLGNDGVAGTDDDLRVLTLVYKGWLY